MQYTANLCIREKANTSTRNMFPAEGKRCVCDVFDEAVKDMAPWSGHDGGSGGSGVGGGKVLSKRNSVTVVGGSETTMNPSSAAQSTMDAAESTPLRNDNDGRQSQVPMMRSIPHSSDR